MWDVEVVSEKNVLALLPLLLALFVSTKIFALKSLELHAETHPLMVLTRMGFETLELCLK